MATKKQLEAFYTDAIKAAKIAFAASQEVKERQTLANTLRELEQAATVEMMRAELGDVLPTLAKFVKATIPKATTLEEEQARAGVVTRCSKHGLAWRDHVALTEATQDDPDACEFGIPPKANA